MKSLFIIPLVLMSLISSPSWALSMDDLVWRDGFFYEKFTSTPVSGELDEGRERGLIKNGKKEGYWEQYWETGQLLSKGNYKNGKREGSWEFYNEDGTVFESFTGTWKNGDKVKTESLLGYGIK